MSLSPLNREGSNRHGKNMTIIALIIGLFLALVIQGSLGSSGLVRGIRPELLVCLVAYTGMYSRLHTIILFGFLAGVSQDALSHTSQGISALAYVTVGMMIYSQRNMLYDKGLIPIMLTCAIATIWTGAVSFLLVNLMQRDGFYWSIHTSEIILAAAVVNLFAGPVVFIIINLLRKLPLLIKNKRKRRV